MYRLPGLVLVLVSQTRANLPSLPYPLRSSLGYHGPVLVLVLVPLSYSASLGQPRQCITCPGSYSYWAAKRGQMCLVCPTACAVRLGITGTEHTRPCWYLAGTSFVQCFAWSAQAMYHLPGLVLVLVSQTRANVPSLPYPLRSSLGITSAEHTRPCWYCAGTSFVQCFARLVQCFAWSVRVMYLLALVCIYTGTSCAVGQHGHCTLCPCP